MSDPLQVLCQAIGDMLEPMASLLRDEGDGPPWSALGDPDRIPEAGLPWLGQFVGVRVTGGASAAVQRQEIKDAAGWRRGTPAALVAAVQATLTDTKSVLLEEQYGSAYTIRVTTLEGETPDQVATEAAALSQKPAGIVLVYVCGTGDSWDSIYADIWDSKTASVWDDYGSE